MNNLAKIIMDDAIMICQKIDFKILKGKNIVITGASGLIGIYFLACLNYLNKTQKLNIKTAAIMRSFFPKYLKDLIDFAELKMVNADITDYNVYQNIPESDFIIHAAGYGQPGKFMEDKIKTLQINTFSTFLLFEKLKPGGNFLFVSSSEVYSGLKNPPFNENQIGTTNTDHPRSCYIEGKRCGEAICIAKKQNGINAKAVRLSQTYGPGTKPNDQRVLYSFIQKAIRTKEIRLIDQGETKRTYCYITDAIEIMWNILLNGKETVYNVGGNSKITIGDLAKIIGKHFNVPVIFPENSNNALNGAPEDVSLDMSRASNEFNKKDYIDFTEGLERTIEWQRELYRDIKI